jgi:predicted RecB family nuclease
VEPSRPQSIALDAYAAIRCEVRLQHSLDEAIPAPSPADLDEAAQRRVQEGRDHEAAVLEQLAERLGDDFVAIPIADRSEAQRLTQQALASGRRVIAQAWLPLDESGHRRGRPDLLVRVDDGYVPVEIKSHLLTEEGNGSIASSPFESPFPADAVVQSGRRLRRSAVWFDDALQLAHYVRMLEALGIACSDRELLGGVIDRSATLWWLDRHPPRGRGPTALDEYDERFAHRLALAEQTARRNTDASIPRAAVPWFHKECERCEYEGVCTDELEALDDVSLVRWSNPSMLARLRLAGVETRRQLAALELDLVDVAERLASMSLSFPQVLELAREVDAQTPMHEVVGRRMGVRRHLEQAGIAVAGDLTGRDPATLVLAGHVKDLGRLVRRARARLSGGVLLAVPGATLDAARADVEVDVDMESSGTAAYLWGAQVTLRTAVTGVEEGYRSFVSFEPLDDDGEAAIFASFWSWLTELRACVRSQGKTFRAYCFWHAAEESQMRRAAAIGGDGVPTGRTLEHFFRSDEWADLHELVSRQLVTDGRQGLKVLATRAGFSWRDEDPSGEASIGWYFEAIGDDPTLAAKAQARLLAYNEDDVLATRALREWLDGPARALPLVDEVPSQAR